MTDDLELALFDDEPTPARIFPPAVSNDREDPMATTESGFSQGRTQRGRQRQANSPCRSCRAPMQWVAFGSGKRNPLNTEPSPDGEILVVEHEDASGRPWRLAIVIKSETLREEAKALGIPLYQTHFATCPDAEEHRRERDRVARRGTT